MHIAHRLSFCIVSKACSYRPPAALNHVNRLCMYVYSIYRIRLKGRLLYPECIYIVCRSANDWRARNAGKVVVDLEKWVVNHHMQSRYFLRPNLWRQSFSQHESVNIKQEIITAVRKRSRLLTFTKLPDLCVIQFYYSFRCDCIG